MNPYRVAAQTHEAKHPLHPLAGTFEAELESVEVTGSKNETRLSLRSEDKRAALYARIDLTPQERAAIGALIGSGRVRITVEPL